jgi:hypothetical protein
MLSAVQPDSTRRLHFDATVYSHFKHTICDWKGVRPGRLQAGTLRPIVPEYVTDTTPSLDMTVGAI